MFKNYLIPLFILLGCSSPVKKQVVVSESKHIKYATTFHFEDRSDKSILVIDEPWPNASERKEYSLEKPLARVVCTSTSHLPYFELLGMEEVVVGFPNLNYISSETFRKRANDGLLIDLGPDGNLNMELLMSLNPDAVIAFDMGGEASALDKVEEAGIPVIYNSDFLEQSPLGRAEWIKFFGALLSKNQEADSIFSVIENTYLNLVELGQSYNEKPSILSGVVYGDTWFLPGGQNWASTFFTNAGGAYIWESDTTSGWLELSFESVYEQAVNADFWIGTSTINSRGELIGQDERYQSFRPFEDDQVYNYNKKRGPNGGYDFFESGYSRPDLVLSDLIKILHPEALPEYETIYFQKLE